MIESEAGVSKDENSKSEVPTRKLIKLIRSKPMLWDRSLVNYRDKRAKVLAWEDVYRHMDPSYDSLNNKGKSEIRLRISKKWCNIRDAYVKCLKKSNKTYIYSDLLTFLDPIYAGVEMKNDTMMNIADENSNDEDNASTFEENEIYLDVDETENAEIEPFKRAKLDTNDTDESIVAVLANLIQKEEDEDRAFFKSITPAVKSLSVDSRFEFRIQVMKLIKDLKRKETRTIVLKKEKRSDTDSD